tara:strand:+ start:279 stop:866 length:588 start_codon:yes stop_codon:yes gene_type:complete
MNRSTFIAYNDGRPWIEVLSPQQLRNIRRPTIYPSTNRELAIYNSVGPPTPFPPGDYPIPLTTLPGHEEVPWDGVYRPDLPSIRDIQQVPTAQPFIRRELARNFPGYVAIPEAARVQHPPEGRPVYAMPIGNNNNVRPDTITRANYYHPVDGKRTTWNKLRDCLPRRTKKAAPVHPSSRNGGKRKRRKNTRKKRI